MTGYERPTADQHSYTGEDQRWTPPPPHQSQPQQTQQQQPHAYVAPVVNSKADSAFALGIMSIFFNFFFVPGILAIVWGGRERRVSSKANTGYICGIIGTVLSAMMTLFDHRRHGKCR